MPAVKGKGCGGRREGAGRKPGSKNRRTRELFERIDAEAEEGEFEDVVVLLVRWANDPTQDVAFRAACAGKAAEFLHPKPSRLPERLPLPHEIPDALLQDWSRRLKEDEEKNPWRYGPPRTSPIWSARTARNPSRRPG